MNRIRSESGTNRVEDDGAGPVPPVRQFPRGRRGTTHRWWGEPVRVALVLVLVLSLMPAPLIGPVAAQPPENVTIPEPPAKAVKLLERLRDRGVEQRAEQRRPGPRSARSRSARVRIITRKGCTFRERGRTWTLVRNCAPRGTIVVPNGFTLDGQNRKMTVTGKVRKFDGAVVVAGFGQANVRNLRIEGNARLGGACPDLGAGILFFFVSGTIANVRVRNIESRRSGCFQSAGIYAIGDKRVNILNSTIEGAGTNGLILQGLVGGTIAGNNVRIASRQVAGFATGIQSGGTSNLVMRNNDFRLGGDDQAIGIAAVQSANLTIFGNRFQSLLVGISVSSAPVFAVPSTTIIRDNQMTGVTGSGVMTQGGSVLVLRNSVAGPPTRGVDGLFFNLGTTGQANNNVIANFNCGINNLAGPGVTIGAGAQANAFLNNNDDVCPP